MASRSKSRTSCRSQISSKASTSPCRGGKSTCWAIIGRAVATVATTARCRRARSSGVPWPSSGRGRAPNGSSRGNERSMSVKMFGMLLVALALGAAGQMFMKRGLNMIGEIGHVSTLLQACLHPMVIIGLGFYVISSMLYLVLMSRMPLSLLYPMVALNYVFITILSRYFFHDHVNPQRIIGLGVIIVGVVLVGLSQRPA